jgi:hypothetical protein
MAIIGEYDPKKDIGSTVRFLSSVLEKTDAFARHIDSQVNILVGISSGIFIFSASKMSQIDISPFFVLTIFSGISVIMGLLAIHPPKSLRKRGQAESLFYNKKIISFSDSDAYFEELNKIVGDSDLIVREFSVEIFNASKYYYRPKRKLFVWSRNSLLLGIILSFLLLIFS